MKQIFHKLHLWLSVPFGLIISIICLSGAALVFETEITEFCYPERYFVKEVKEKPLPIADLVKKVGETLPDSITVSGINIPSDPNRMYQVNLSKPRRASVYVDQYTGEVKPRFQRVGFFNFMFRTHRWLLDSMKPDGEIFWGKMIVGTSTLLMVFIIISGIVIWIPKTVKSLKAKLKISFDKGLKRFWYDLHVVGGIYAALILLVLALTGLTWSFSWYRTGFYKVFGVEVQQGNTHGNNSSAGQQQTPPSEQNNRKTTISEDSIDLAKGRKHYEKANLPEKPDSSRRERRGRKYDQNAIATNGMTLEQADSLKQERLVQEGKSRREKGKSPQTNYDRWQSVYEHLATENPTYKQISISKNSANVSFDGWGNQRGSDRYSFAPETGDITEVKLYKDQDKSGKIRGWIYSVHVGSWGGILTRILTFIAAFIGGTLPLTGYYLWIRKKLKKRSKARQKENNK